MTAPPEIAEQRAVEWDRWDCAECGETCVGDPLAHWCGEAS